MPGSPGFFLRMENLARSPGFIRIFQNVPPAGQAEFGCERGAFLCLLLLILN